jgi:hypothetical protein
MDAVWRWLRLSVCQAICTLSTVGLMHSMQDWHYQWPVAILTGGALGLAPFVWSERLLAMSEADLGGLSGLWYAGTFLTSATLTLLTSVGLDAAFGDGQVQVRKFALLALCLPALALMRLRWIGSSQE